MNKYDPRELERGIEVEKEHTDDPHYYSRLLACGIAHNPRGTYDDPNFYISSGRKDALYTLRARWQESRGADRPPAQSDRYVITLTADPNTALQKANAWLIENGHEPLSAAPEFELVEMHRSGDWSWLRGGKYEGMYIDELLQTDPEYALWAVFNLRGPKFDKTMELLRVALGDAYLQKKAEIDAKSKAYEAATEARKEKTLRRIELLQPLAHDLHDSRGGFRDSVAEVLERGELPSGRGLSIMLDILAKLGGRRGSNGYDAEYDRLTAILEEVEALEGVEKRNPGGTKMSSQNRVTQAELDDIAERLVVDPEMLELLDEWWESSGYGGDPDDLRSYGRRAASYRDPPDDFEDMSHAQQREFALWLREQNNPGGTKASCHCVHAPGDISDYEGIRAEYTVSNVGKKQIKSFEDLVDYAREVLNVEADTRERFYAIYMNQKNRVLGHRLIGAGSMTEALVHPSLVFGPAVALQAPIVAYIHNHPGEEGTPSNTDIELTKRLVNAGHNMLGIRTLDHVVIGRQNSVSMYEKFPDAFTPEAHNPPYPEHESELTWEPAVSANPRIDISESYKLFEPEQAEAVAEDLRESDPDWTYEVKHDPKGTGKSFIEIYDEDGEYVGRV